jgi:hypothetical protein
MGTNTASSVPNTSTLGTNSARNVPGTHCNTRSNSTRSNTTRSYNSVTARSPIIPPLKPCPDGLGGLEGSQGTFEFVGNNEDMLHILVLTLHFSTFVGLRNNF